jgi:hypothetical protein
MRSPLKWTKSQVSQDFQPVSTGFASSPQLIRGRVWR